MEERMGYSTGADGSVAEAKRGTTVDVLAIAKDLRGKIAERADWTDRERRLPEETLAELRESGLLKLNVPKRYGGLGATMAQWLEVDAELAKGCTSTAWVHMISNGLASIASVVLGPEGRQEILGSADSPMVCGVLTISEGQAKRVDGGYLVNGSWGFASGSLHAEWALGICALIGEDGTPVDACLAFMPMDQIRVKDTWKVTGMRGTGSNTIIAEDVFVPEHMTVLQSDLNEREFWGPDTEPAERWELAPQFGVGVLAPSLGAAEAIYEVVAGNMQKRGITYFHFDRQADSAVALEQLGEARLRLDSAWLMERRGISALEDVSLERPMTMLERARTRADAGFVAAEIRDAVDTLMGLAGASAYAEASPLQRHWRDVSVATRHAMLNTKPTMENYGRALLGEPLITDYV